MNCIPAGRTRHPTRLFLTSSAVALAALMPGSAGAQDSAPTAAFALEEIVVTATRRSESVQDVPYNISVLGGGDVDRLGLRDIGDLARVTPGLTLIDAGPRSVSSTIIRGLSVDPLRTPDTEDNGTVATYLNETPLLIQPKLIDVARVEVLRGPQGTLYGSGSIGGAIRYILNNPDLDEVGGSAGVDLYQIKEADSLSKEVTAVVNVPLVTGKAALRVAANYLDDSGFVDYPLVIAGAEEDADSEERQTARISLGLAPTGWLDLTGSFYFDFAKAGGRTGANPGFRPDPARNDVADRPVGQPQVTLGKYDLASRYVEPFESRNRIYALEAKADIGFAEIVSSTSYIKSQDNGQRDQTDLLLGFEYGYEDYPEFSAFTREDDDLEIFVQEVRLVSAGEGPLQYVVGAYFTDEDLLSLSREFVPGFPDFIGVDRPDALEYYEQAISSDKERALFGEVTYRLTEAWQVTGGARWFNLKQDREFCLAFPLIDGSAPTEIAPDCEEGNSDIKDSIFKLNTSYDVTDDAMVYATWSQGFRRGGANSVPVGGQVEIDPNERFFNPDTVDNYEAGLRSTWLDGRAVLNTALFYIDWNDIQVASRTAEGSIPITTNAGGARSKGLEIEGRFAATEELTLFGGYAYIDAELTRTTPTRGGTFEEGTRLPGSPKHAFSLGLDYEHAIAWGTVNWHVDGNYSSGITTAAIVEDNPDFDTFGGYTLVNAAVSLSRDDGWTARLYARNLFDEYAYLGQRGPAAYGDQGRFYLIPRPRTVGLEIGKSF